MRCKAFPYKIKTTVVMYLLAWHLVLLGLQATTTLRLQSNTHYDTYARMICTPALLADSPSPPPKRSPSPTTHSQAPIFYPTTKFSKLAKNKKWPNWPKIKNGLPNYRVPNAGQGCFGLFFFFSWPCYSYAYLLWGVRCWWRWAGSPSVM